MDEIERRLLDRAGNAPISRPTGPPRASTEAGGAAASTLAIPDPQVEALIQKFRK